MVGTRCDHHDAHLAALSCQVYLIKAFDSLFHLLFLSHRLVMRFTILFLLRLVLLSFTITLAKFGPLLTPAEHPAISCQQEASVLRECHLHDEVFGW